MNETKTIQKEIKQLTTLLQQQLSDLQKAKLKVERISSLINRTTPGASRSSVKTPTSRASVKTSALPTPRVVLENWEKYIIQTIRKNPGINTTGIRNALNLQEVDPSVGRVHTRAMQLEDRKMIRSKMCGRKRCWWIKR